MTKLDERETTFRKVRVNHPAQQRAFEQLTAAIEEARHEPNVITFVGPTGVGKTNLLERIELWATQRFAEEAEKTGRQAYLPVTAMAPTHREFNFRHFFRDILVRAGDPFIQHQSASAARRISGDDMEAAAMGALRNRHPIVFAVDEAQHMTLAMRTERITMVMELIKWMAVDSRVPILLAGTSDLLKLPLLSDQLSRRTPHVVLNPYRFDRGVKLSKGQVHEIDEFIAAAEYFRDRLPVTARVDLKDDEIVDLLYMGSCGAIGILKPWFNRALHRALVARRSFLTADDLRSTMHAPGKLKRIAQAITTSRKLEALLDVPIDEVRKELGMPPATPKTPRPERDLKPGQRRLVRDRVGTDDEPEDAAA